MTCPPDDALRQFLNAQAGAHGPAIESHLEECERCRQAVERLTLDPTGLRERFRREGQVIARLRHPNVVRVIEVGEAYGAPYMVLEYVAGRSLADHLTGTPWASPPSPSWRFAGCS